MRREIHPFEAGLLKQVSLALKDGNLDAVLEFIKICEKYGIIVRLPSQQVGGVLRIPKTWDRDEWMQMFEKYGPPP